MLPSQSVDNDIVAQMCHFSGVNILVSIGLANQQCLVHIEALTVQWKERVVDNNGTCIRILKTKPKEKGMIRVLFSAVEMMMPLCNDRLMSLKRKITKMNCFLDLTKDRSLEMYFKNWLEKKTMETLYICTKVRCPFENWGKW